MHVQSRSLSLRFNPSASRHASCAVLRAHGSRQPRIGSDVREQLEGCRRELEQHEELLGAGQEDLRAAAAELAEAQARVAEAEAALRQATGRKASGGWRGCRGGGGLVGLFPVCVVLW